MLCMSDAYEIAPTKSYSYNKAKDHVGLWGGLRLDVKLEAMPVAYKLAIPASCLGFFCQLLDSQVGQVAKFGIKSVVVHVFLPGCWANRMSDESDMLSLQ